MPPFAAKVKSVAKQPLDWSKAHHSAAMDGVILVVEKEDGGLLVLDQPYLDASWGWTAKFFRLEAGKKYWFDPGKREVLERD